MSVVVDPVETVIKFLEVNGAALGVGSRVAGKHRFGADNAWTPGQKALMVQLDGGEDSNNVPLHQVRLELRIYAATPAQAMDVWKVLIPLARGVNREVVTTSSGSALLHALLQASGPSFAYDDQVGCDFLMQFFTAIVGEDSL
jgi:hypothetical protein